MSDRVHARHLQRKAIVYVRQSTARQLSHNQESRRLQYAMKERLSALGWTDIEVIDDDLGRSASGKEERPGFSRLVAAVGLGQVGAVAAREVSRFARNSVDWQQLIEVCRDVDTLLIDEESIYDPRGGNDRLLLGVKGSLNEYELDLLRLRSLEARQEKARRGEYYARIPAGYCKNENGKLEKHADRRVRQVVQLVFDKAVELGSVRQLLLWLRENGIEVPRNYGNRQWRAPQYSHLIAMLKNPIYAGCYVYGKTKTTWVFDNGIPKRHVERTRRSDWILIPNRHEGYISNKQYDRIQDMITKNSQSRKGGVGAPKRGIALLAGLIRCRRCGRKLMSGYSGERRNVVRYSCRRGEHAFGDPSCISFSGADVDGRVAAEILEVVKPAAIEAAVLAAQQHVTQGNQLVETLRVELEAARYAANRAWKQYDAVDPENRLVASGLETRWNEALERVQDIEERLAKQSHVSSPDDPLNPAEFLRLGQDFDAVWNNRKIDARLKKRLVRTLIEEIVADIESTVGEIVLVIHWKGGVHTHLRIPKRPRGRTTVCTPDEVIEAVRKMTLVCDDKAIARWLSRAGLLTARGNRWSRELVASLRHTHNIPRHDPDRRRAEGWITMREAARRLDVAHQTVARAVKQNILPVIRPLPVGLWIFREADLRRPEVLTHFQNLRSGRHKGTAPSSEQLNLNIPSR